jgi:membrane protein YfhO
VSLHRLAPLIALALLFAWMFAGPLFGSGMFCFRDAAHYYYPLFEFTADQWAKGDLPLWNPYENLGVPLAADVTASVFYPGKLIFGLPLDYSRLYKLYIAAHVLLAAATAYVLARQWKVSRDGAGLAAICYAFSGNVLYQYCNVVFLVGAAWLPLAVLSADRALVGRSIRWAVALGVVLAMITLGGDPQMAYHCGLLTVMYATCLWWRETGGPRQLARSRTALILIAVTCGLALSAVQVLPSLEFNRLGHRTITSVARNVWEVAPCIVHDRSSPLTGDSPLKNGTGTSQQSVFSEKEASQLEASPHFQRAVASTWYDGLLCRNIEPGSHQEHAYHFSVGPWRLAEYVWPNFGGRQFPVHRRWMEVIPAEGRLWVPSLYMGLLPMVLAIASLRFRRTDPRTQWMSWTVVLGVAAAFGWYGVGWLLMEVRGAAGADLSRPWLVGEPVGGIYWLLTVLLPGYVNFRYPAKWLVVAALGLSILAAGGWDRVQSGGSGRIRPAVLGLGAVSLLGALLALAVRPFWHQWLAGVEPDALFGPLDTVGAADDLVRAFSHTALVSGLCYWLIGWGRNGRRWAGPAMLILVAVDLAAANGWMVASTPADAWTGTSKLATVIEAAQAESPDGGPYRIYRRPIWMPPSFKVTSSSNRLAEALRWDRDTLWPKYNLSPRISVAEVHGAMMPYDYQILLREIRRRGVDSVPAEADLAWLNAEYAIVRKADRGSSFTSGENLGLLDRFPEDVSLRDNPQAFPRAWIVHRVELMPPIDPRDSRQVRQRTRDVFWPRGKRRDLRFTAVVEETEERAPFSPTALSQSDEAILPVANHVETDSEYCRVVRHEPLRVELESQLNRPGLVVLCDQFCPGWRLEVETAGRDAEAMPILRTNRVMRGAWLPAGQHRLIWTYRPASFRIGATLSTISWLVLAVGLISLLRHPKPSGGSR